MMKVNINEQSFSSAFTPQDTEYLDSGSLGHYYEGITQSLLKMSDDHFLKIYFNAGDIYINTNSDFLPTGIKSKDCPSLLQNLMGKKTPLTDVLNRGDHLKIGGKYLRFLRLTEFPQEIADQGHFNGLGRYFMTMRKIPRSHACSILDRKRKIFRSDNTGDFANYKSEEGEGQAEELLAQIQLNTEGLFEIEFWFWILSDTEEELTEQTGHFLSFFKHSEGKVKIEDIGLSEVFLNFIPGTPPSFIRSMLTSSNYLLGLMPLSGDYLHDNGIVFHSLSDKSIFFNNFSGANFNMAIIGHSGSGKTFLAQKIVNHHLGEGLKAVILDRGHSFDHLARYHEGTIFGDKLNPLQFKNVKFLVEFLSSFMPKREFSYHKKCLLFKTIRENLAAIKNLDTLFIIIDKKIPEFSLYFEEYRELFTDEFIQMSEVTYVDTRKYPENFLRPLFIYLTEYIKNLDGQKIFVFEECWHTLQHNINYLGEFFRTSRSQGISCIAITQRLDDLLASGLGKIIAENTYFKILFSVPQKENEYLDNYDLERIAELKSRKDEYSEFYLKTPLHRKTLRFYPTMLEHESFTSNFKDRKKIDRFISEFKNHFNYKTLIHRWTELKYGKNINMHLSDYKDEL